MAQSPNELPMPAEALGSADLEQIVREKMDVIRQEREKMRACVSRIEREIEDLLAVLRARKAPERRRSRGRPAAARPAEDEPDALDEEQEKPRPLNDGSKWTPELIKMIEESFSRKMR